MRNRSVAAAAVVSLLAAGAEAQTGLSSLGSGDEFPPCQILDKACGSQYAVSLGYIPESALEGYGKTSTIDLEATWEFAYYRDVLLADIDLRVDGGLTFLDPAGVDLPDAVGELALNAGMTWRYVNNTALQVRTRPGLYSDMHAIDTDSFYVPFSGSLIWAVHPQLSGSLGLEVRPRFERAAIPLARLEWEASKSWRVGAGFPSTRVTWYGLPDWSLYGALDWRSDTFHLDDEGEVDREQVTFEDFRLYVGAGYSVLPELQVVGEVGTVFERSVEFDESPENVRRDIDIDSDLFVRIGVVGPF